MWLLKLLSYTDVIGPLVWFWRNGRAGATHTFGIPLWQAWAPWDVQRLLRDNGIRSWCYTHVRKEVTSVTVHRSDAMRAQQLIDDTGVAVCTPRFAPKPVQNSGSIRWLFG